MTTMNRDDLLETFHSQIGRSLDYLDSRPGGVHWDEDFVSCNARVVANILDVLLEMEHLVDLAADFVQVVNEDHNLSKPVVMPGEFDTLAEAVQRWRNSAKGTP
jgi:hypothetical protein